MQYKFYKWCDERNFWIIKHWNLINCIFVMNISYTVKSHFFFQFNLFYPIIFQTLKKKSNLQNGLEKYTQLKFSKTKLEDWRIILLYAVFCLNRYNYCMVEMAKMFRFQIFFILSNNTYFICVCVSALMYILRSILSK